MQFRSIISQSFKMMVNNPMIWFFGLLVTYLGWSNLPIALFSTMVRSEGNPIGKGSIGFGIIFLIIFISFFIEIAIVKSITLGKKSPLQGLIFSLKNSTSIFIFILTLIVVLIGVDLLVALPLFSLLGTQFMSILAFILPFLVNLSWIVFSGLSAIALFIPILIMIPLGIRFFAISEGKSKSVFGGMVVFSESMGRSFLCVLLCLLLDIAVFLLGTKLDISEITLTSKFGIVSEWIGDNQKGGFIVLIIASIATMFKFSMWTVLYQDVIQIVEKNYGSDLASLKAESHILRHSFVLVLNHIRESIKLMLSSPKLLILAAIIALIGMPGPVNILTLYNLFPAPQQSANEIVYSSAWPLKGGLFFIIAIIALVIVGVLNIALIFAAFQKIQHKQVKLIESIGVGFRKFWKIMIAGIKWFIISGFIGGIIIVIVLFSMAFIVQYVPGIDSLANGLEWIIIVLVAVATVVVTPFIARAILIDKETAGSAFSLAAEVAWKNPVAVLLVFLITFSLDLIKGPLASLFGYITMGWLDITAIFRFRTINPPIEMKNVIGSIALYFISMLIFIFQAYIWTILYQQLSSKIIKKQKS